MFNFFLIKPYNFSILESKMDRLKVKKLEVGRSADVRWLL